MVRALVVALVTGLVWMHGLDAGHHTGSHTPAGHTVEAAPDHQCAGSGHSDCPDAPEHHAPVCRSGALASAPAVTAPGQLAALPRVDQVDPGPLSPATAAVDAAGGTGCGPPSLTELSISRT